MSTPTLTSAPGAKSSSLATELPLDPSQTGHVRTHSMMHPGWDNYTIVISVVGSLREDCPKSETVHQAVHWGHEKSPETICGFRGSGAFAICATGTRSGNAPRPTRSERLLAVLTMKVEGLYSLRVRRWSAIPVGHCVPGFV